MITAFLALAVGMVSNEPAYVENWRVTLLVERLATTMPSERFSAAVKEGQAIPFQAIPIGVFYKLKGYLPSASSYSSNSELFVQMNPRMYIRNPESKAFYEVDLKSVPSLSMSRMPVPTFSPAKELKSPEGKLMIEAQHAAGRLVDLMLKTKAIPSYLTLADFQAGQQPLSKVDAPGIEWLKTLAAKGTDLSPKKDLGALLNDEERRSKCTVEFVVQCFLNLKEKSGTSGLAFNLP